MASRDGGDGLRLAHWVLLVWVQEVVGAGRGGVACFLEESHPQRHASSSQPLDRVHWQRTSFVRLLGYD